MSEAPRKEIPLPKGDDDFEDLVLALFRVVWQDSGAKLHGRCGQRQDGVDLYGEDRFGGSGLNGVQCKQHGSATPLDKDLVAELREEVDKAKGFRPPLHRFIFSTTARRSVTLQHEARDLTELHRKDGLFAVEILAWEDIEDLLRRHSDVLAWYLDERTKAPTLYLDIGRLPIPGPHFLGRDAEMVRLDAAWEEPALHVLTLVAFGGVGKSALVARWMDRMAADGWRGAARVLDWSFYSQGSKDQNTSAELFIDHALRFFSDSDPKAGSLHDRGARLARLVREKRTLLVLDGIEPLQYPPGRPEIEGRLKDPGLAALLKGLAASNPGLCVVTTRERIADLAGSPSSAPQITLEKLEPGAAVALLRQLGVDGREVELTAVAKEFQHHALTLTLLGNFLRRAYGGDVRKWREIDLHHADEKQGGHASRVIAAYARWLGEGPELAILRLLGLFDRPAEADALKALRAAPSIPKLTEPLVGLSDEDWRLSTATLRDHGLLLAADPREPETLDAHPLVRACFAEELEGKHLDAWQKGNRRLYHHLLGASLDLPDTLETMQPLYAAVVHGCRAGLQKEALEDVYWRRVLRGEKGFSWRKLGAFGSELTALAGLFDRPWSQPSACLTVEDQAFVLNAAALRLRALGRLAEAAEPMQAGLEVYIAGKDWKSAAAVAGNLSELTLTLGKVSRAVTFGEQSVEFADLSGDVFQRLARRATWADALHQAGRWEESAAAFCEAETMQAEHEAQCPRLYSLQGFQYCDLLLGRAEPEAGPGLDGVAGPGSRPKDAKRFRQACQEVQERAQQFFYWHMSSGPLLEITLDHLTLGRAHLGLALTATGEDSTTMFTQAVEQLDWAVDGLRRAGREDYLPRGLLARVALRRFRSDFPGATADLTEALEIAERGPMRRHECDAHLEWARLRRDQGDFAAARQHVVRARELMDETGYGRREREVRWLESELAKENARSDDGKESSATYEASSMTTPTRRFRVALSFPGEHRSVVEQVAEHLSAAVGRESVLYDKFYEAEFSRIDLDVYLPRLYREQSDLIILFLCKEYPAKHWCRLEWRHIRQLIATVNASRIMPLSFGSPGDLSEIGILSGDGYVDIADRSATEIAGLILQRLDGTTATTDVGRPSKGVADSVMTPGSTPSPDQLLQQLKQLPAAQFEELVFRHDSENSVPGKSEAQSIRAIELLKVMRSRDGGLVTISMQLQRLERGGGQR